MGRPFTKNSLNLVAGAILLVAGPAYADDVWIEDPVTGCKIWAEDEDPKKNVATWSGPCVEDQVSGEGVLVWHCLSLKTRVLDGDKRPQLRREKL